MAAENRAASAKYLAAPGSPFMYPFPYMWINVTTKDTMRSITSASGSINMPTLNSANQCMD